MWRTRPSYLSLVLLAAIASTACTRHAFLDEREAAPYAGLLERGAALRHEFTRVNGSEPGETPVRVALEYVRSRQGPTDRILVCVGGIFSCRDTWRFVVGPLGERYDLLLMDPPGCGSSDAPEPDWSGSDVYTPEWLARHELRALEAWSTQRGDTRPVTLVGHSLGAASVLRMIAHPDLARHAPSLLARVNRLVLISVPDLVIEDAPPTLERMATIGPLEVDLLKLVGRFQTTVEDGIWNAQYEPRRSAFFQDVGMMKCAVGTRRTREASQAMVRRYNPTHLDGTLDLARADRLRAAVERMPRPALVLCGEADDTVGPEAGRRIAALLPRGRFLEIARARHSPHQEQAPEVIRAILEFHQEVPAGE